MTLISYRQLRTATPMMPLLIAFLMLCIFSMTRIGLGIYTGFDLIE